MTRPHRSVPLAISLALLALGALGALGAWWTPARAASDRWTRHAAVLARADSLQRAGQTRAGLAVLDSLLVFASQSENADLRIAALMGRARAHLILRDAGATEAEVRSLLPDLQSARDALGLALGMRYLGRAAELRNRRDEARRSYEKSLAYARQAHAATEQAYAELGLASLDRASGNDARAVQLARQALAAFETAGDVRAAILGRTSLARGLRNLGRTDEARALYERARSDAQERNDLVSLAEIASSLGALEHGGGDPSKAVALYREALEMDRRLGLREAALVPIYNLSLVYVNLGRYDEADSVLLQVLPEARAIRDLDTRALLLSELGVVRRERQRPQEAVEYGRQAVALSDSIPVRTAIGVTTIQIANLRALGRKDLALALVESQMARLRPRAAPAMLRELSIHRSILLHQLGRPGDALPALRELATDWKRIPRGVNGADRIRELAGLARCYRDAGKPDSALLWFGRVSDAWESWRKTTANAVWREKFDDFSNRFTGEYLAALLDTNRVGTPESRARQAFDVAQRFRARTLIDRIQDPAGKPIRPRALVRTTEFQQQVLRSGEVFLDVYAQPESTFVFAITRDRVRAYGLGGGDRRADRVRRLRDLLSSHDETAPPTAAQASLGRELFEPAADLIRSANRVLIAAGTLSLFPLDQVIVPGDRDVMAVEREVTWIPSASVLAEGRRTSPTRTPLVLLAVAQSAAVQGVSLPAARREAEWLSSQFTSTEMLADASVGSARQVAARASGYQIIHFASHTRSGGRRPWQDALHLGGGMGDEAWLTAAQIAQLRIPARLCVLAGCSTMGRESRWGETLDGLATAWIAAGARTVIATRWDVDDDATSELVRGFYRRLASGEVAAAALRHAQLEMRAQPRYALPFYWAGAFLLGEPTTRVVLTRRAY